MALNWTVPAFLCADTPTRVTMLQLADGVDIGVRFYQFKGIIDAAWELAYPGDELRKFIVMNNLRILTQTIIIEGESIEVYTAPQSWCDRVRFARAAGEIALLSPKCQRATFLTLPE